MLPNVPRTVLPTRRALGVTPHRTSFRCRNSSSNSISSIKMFDWKEVSHNRYVMICYNRLRSRANRENFRLWNLFRGRLRGCAQQRRQEYSLVPVGIIQEIFLPSSMSSNLVFIAIFNPSGPRLKMSASQCEVLILWVPRMNNLLLRTQ